MEHSNSAPTGQIAALSCAQNKQLPSQRARLNQRLLVYAALALCDTAAIRCAFEIAVNLKGHQWLSPNGLELGWLILPLHLLIGLRNGAYSNGALVSRLDSIRLASRSLLVATALVSLLIFFQAAGPLVSRLGFGTGIALSFVFMWFLRVSFLTLFVGQDVSRMFSRLVIVDGPPSDLPISGHVIYASDHGLKPDLEDFSQLARIAELLVPHDQLLIISADKKKRSEWAIMAKSFGITAEVMLDEGSPLGAIALGRYLGRDTVVVSRGPLSLPNRINKRLMDLALASLALLLVGPLLLFVAIAIKIDSPGPVFFRQPRVGRSNRLFNILKFRSMRVESTDVDGTQSTRPDDERVTRVGRFIRATSIDELPQLINVLRSDMSMVGPRPHALGSLAGDELFWKVDNAYWRRHALKPGITGLAQVRGFRGATHRRQDLTNRLQADLEYVSNWSLWGDFKILVATARVLIHPQAY